MSHIEVLGHVPADADDRFDDAALAAARTLRFQPARRGDQALTVRVRYHLVVAPPVVTLGRGPAAQDPHTPIDLEPGLGTEGVGHVHEDPHAHEPETTGSHPPAPAPPTAPTTPSDADSREGGVTVQRERTPPSRGGGDFVQRVGPLAQVPRQNASDLLRLAPGILLTNEGGDGHAERVYLRGFDAREGQDVEFTVNGVPVNEAGNPAAEGYADTHFVIPELVRTIRVTEGPFDPHQGNYAVAGSADYQLGLDARGWQLRYEGGLWNTHRVLALWAPDERRRGTFAGVDLRTTDGWGANRASRLARAMGQWEHALSGTTTLQLLVTSYLTHFGTAGVVRQDDLTAGRIGFDGTYDGTQGGDMQRHGVSFTVEDVRAERTLRQQVFLTLRDFHVRENFTGFLHDPPAPWRTGTQQRGDALDLTAFTVTAGARGSMRFRFPWLGQTQSVEAGYYARFDHVDSSSKRLRAGTVVPYRTEFDLGQNLGNLGLYADAELRFSRWATLRGGVRADYFAFDVQSRCDLHDLSLGSGVTPVDTLCYTADRSGVRDPGSRRFAQGLAFQPRVNAVVGPFRGVSLTGSFGMGARAADPLYLSDGNQSPFSRLLSAEGGVVFNHSWDALTLDARALYFHTYVDRDLVFAQQQGRVTLAPGTRRQGALAAVRASGRIFDVNASVTYVDARFARETTDASVTYFPPDSGDRVPYVPSVVGRVDAALHGPFPVAPKGHALRGRLALGGTFLSARPLMFGQWGDPQAVLDASAGLRWWFLELGVTVTNFTGQRYRLSEYQYASNFDPSALAPSLVPERHFSAGAPVWVGVNLTIHAPDEEEPR